MMNQNENPMERGGRAPERERRGDRVTALGRSYQEGGEGGVEELTMISLVLRFQSLTVLRRWFVSNYCDFYFLCFFLFLNHMHLFKVQRHILRLLYTPGD